MRKSFWYALGSLLIVAIYLRLVLTQQLFGLPHVTQQTAGIVLGAVIAVNGSRFVRKIKRQDSA